MIALAQSLVAYSYQGFAIDNGHGEVFALLSKAQQVTWQTSFGSAPVAVNIIIETSLDNSVWSAVATTTATAGATGTFVTSAIFIRASIVSHTGGDTVTVGVVAKVGILGIVTPASVTDGSLVEFDGTTGSKFKELVFSGDDTEFLNGDGAFTAPAGGGGGASNIEFDSGKGIIFDGAAAPISIAGGDDGVGDTAILLNNIIDTYIALKFLQYTDIFFHPDDGGSISDEHASIAFNGDGGNLGLTAGVDTNIDLNVSGTGTVRVAGGDFLTTNGNISVSSGKTYKSSDGSSGITQDVTSGTLVGKTMTFKNGILVGFA